MYGVIFAYAGWSYIPNFATRQLLSYFHQFYPKVYHRPPPAPGTPEYYRHYRYAYTLVVVTYLLYNFYQAAVTMEPNLYEILGASPDADANALKVAFRQFARKYHPDRAGQQGEALFMRVRDAFDALKNPTTRFAYDRFGPDALSWTQCTTLREYIRRGLMQSSGFHIVTGCFLCLLAVIGTPSPIAFWRWMIFVALLTYELTYILGPSSFPASATPLSPFLFSNPTSPSFVSVLALFWPRRVAYQHIRFLHSLATFLSVALTKVAPVLFPSPAVSSAKSLAADLQKLNSYARHVHREAINQVQMELHALEDPPVNGLAADILDTPAHPSDDTLKALVQEMETLFIETSLRKDGGPVRSAVEQAAARRRMSVHMPSPAPSPPPAPKEKGSNDDTTEAGPREDRKSGVVDVARTPVVGRVKTRPRSW